MFRHLLAQCILVLSLATVALPGQLVVGLGDTNYPPYQYDISGEPHGTCIERVRMAASNLNMDIKWVRYPWNRLLDMVEKGTIDAMLPILRTPARETFLEFPETPLAFECTGFFTTTNNDISFNGDLKTLKDTPVGVVLNYSYGKAFDAADYLLRKRTYSDKELVSKVLSGRIPIGVGNVAVVRYYARMQDQWDRIRVLFPYLTQAPLYIGFSKAAGKASLAAKFSEALQSLPEEVPAPVSSSCEP